MYGTHTTGENADSVYGELAARILWEEQGSELTSSVERAIANAEESLFSY